MARLGLIAPCLLALAFGCGYSTRGLYPDSIQTVSVPVFKNNTFRRDIEFQLTEKVIQEIEAKTPFKVVGSADADTEIQGTISSFYKAPFGEDPYDNPRGGNMTMVVQIKWIDKRSGATLVQNEKVVSLTATQDFSIDVAQSQASADDIALRKIAQQIVRMLQSPW